MAVQIQMRNGTASQWTSANPTLSVGEIGAETDTGRFKVGNGSTAWNSLPYAVGMTWKGTWSSATTYAVNDVVYYSGSSYISILAGTNQNPASATSYWSTMSLAGTNGTAFTWKGTWSSVTAYVVNDVVFYNNSSYISILAGTNQNPATATTYWSLMASGSGDVVGPASATSGNFASFNGTTGKLIQDSGKATPSGVVVGTTDTQTLSAKTLTNPTVTNYVETLYTNTAGTTVTIDLTNGTVQAFTISGGNATITMPTAVAGKSFILILTQDTTSRTVTWTTVTWPSGTAPTISTGSGKRDIYSFFSNGTVWFGATIGQNY